MITEQKTTEQLHQYQQQANALAIEETNLNEQIEALRAAEGRLVQINRQKHQLLGAIAILKSIVEAEAQADALPQAAAAGA